MTAILGIIKKLRVLASQQDQLIKKTFEDNAEFIEDLQRDQLLRGKTNEGDNIAPKYANKVYAKKKRQKNSKPNKGVPDLKLTGRYHKKMKFKAGAKKGEITNSDSKDEKLSAKYDGIKGLNEKSNSKLRAKTLTDMRALARKILDI